MKRTATCAWLAFFHKPIFFCCLADCWRLFVLCIGECSVPGWSGYDPSCLDCVFDKKEAAFSKTMGFFWSNMASTGNPNFRKDKNYTAVNFPEYSPESEMNILLQPVKAPYTPDTMIKEAGMGRADICKFWDANE
jgi:hypothetical protein